jgi:hypothetical protein
MGSVDVVKDRHEVGVEDAALERKFPIQVRVAVLYEDS